MTSVLRFFLAFVMASAVLLPGLRAPAHGPAHGHVAPSTGLKAIEAVDPTVPVTPTIGADVTPGVDGADAHHGPSEGGAHCDGPFHHHSGCGHVLSYFREIPAWSLVIPRTAAFFEFVPHALPSPDLEGPTQPPRA